LTDAGCQNKIIYFCNITIYTSLFVINEEILLHIIS